MIVLVALGLLVVFYLGLVVLSVVGPRRMRAKDRLAVLEGVADVFVVLLIARLVVPWTPATGWAWVGVVVLLGVLAATPWARRDPDALVAPASRGRHVLRVLTVALRVVVVGAVVAVTV